MTNSMPAYAIFHHRTFLGYVNAVSHAQARTRAKALYPNKRLTLELPVNVACTDADRLRANRHYNNCHNQEGAL